MTDVILLLILLHPLFVQICMIGCPDTQNTPDQECKFDEQQKMLLQKWGFGNKLEVRIQSLNRGVPQWIRLKLDGYSQIILKTWDISRCPERQ
jgi:ribosomal protein L39E